MPIVQLDRLKMHYQQSGTGLDVVLIHGFTSNLAMWMFTEIIPLLSAEFRVTAYDLRGHGHSEVTPSGYDSATMAADLRALHEHLGLQPAYLVGHSFGGVIATHAAVLYPEIVSGVILSDTYYPGLAELEPAMPHAEIWQDLRAALAKTGKEIGPVVDFARLFDAVAGMSDDDRAAVKHELGAPAARWLQQMPPLAATTAGAEMFDPAGLTADRIRSVRQPVAAIYDEHSPFRATCRWLAENVTHVETDCVPGARHLALLENPTGFVETVQRQLRRLTSIQSVGR